MGKFASVLQAITAAAVLAWSVFMAARLLAGGYHAFYVGCFALIAALAVAMLRVSIKELKGGGE